MRIRSGDVTLQSFDIALSDVVLQIRNHPSVRSQMRNSAAIEKVDHERWVSENIEAARSVHLFVVYAADQPVGIALLRDFRGESAEIGVMVMDAVRRPLVCYKAAHLIGYYAFEVLNLKRVVSYVPRHNAHALAFNLHCGLKDTASGTETYHELALSQSDSRSHATHKHFREKYGIEVIQ
jgi:RimJ/RimL family protein N-acetyltransferase